MAEAFGTPLQGNTLRRLLVNIHVTQLRTECILQHSESSKELKYHRLTPTQAEISFTINVFSHF